MKTNKLKTLSLKKQTITRLHSITITAGNMPLDAESDMSYTGFDRSCHSSYC
ncbi:hypothetical protein [uncultured Dokdonia sp.]|uniref:hypothetical protein n=1 Tax=uncultured Dokdonia sp. TaxID=575653 RepID=UPI00262E91A5|nr:hypothetical protein [uncultured Dokdonia sp.]